MKQVIYETRGRAREFNELAINLFTGCEHACIYCYGADVTHKDKEDFKHKVAPRITLDDIGRSASEWRNKGETRRILLCFVTDPYTPIEQQTQFTRQTIAILHIYGFNVHILTKGGKRSMRDFDLLTPQDAYATTLTCLRNEDSLHWEPKAALPADRVEALEEAHKLGIETWVSLEPVIYPEDSRTYIEMLYKIIGHWKVGIMNYHPHGKTINWREFGFSTKRLLDMLGAKYYFKKDLLTEMGLIPANFRQTWICH